MGGFHNNKILHGMIDILINVADVTSFIETGTYGGDTTEYMAKKYPNLPIFTCEINPKFFNNNLRKLGRYKNITAVLESSEKFILDLVGNSVLGDLPLFFLDAHWYDYWPLIDEVANITKLPKFIILPDDFHVPGQPQFGNDSGGGGTLGEHRTKLDLRNCDLDLIRHVLPEGCEIGFPKYDWKDVPEASHLRGHAFILSKNIKNLDDIKSNSFYFWQQV